MKNLKSLLRFFLLPLGAVALAKLVLSATSLEFENYLVNLGVLLLASAILYLILDWIITYISKKRKEEKERANTG